MKVDTPSRHSETGMGGGKRAGEQKPTSVNEILRTERVDSRKQRHIIRLVIKGLGALIVFREGSNHGVVVHTAGPK